MAQKEQMKNDIVNMQWNAEREISNEIAYKNKFVRKDNTMKQRQDKYQQYVMSPYMQKQIQMQDTISKNEETYKKSLENKEVLNKQIASAINEERTRILGKQL